MFRSDEFFQLDQMLCKAGKVGQSLRLSLLRHFGELIRDLTCNLDTDVSLREQGSVGLDGECAPEVTLDEEETLVQVLGTIALSEYGDEVALHAVRMEALRVFEACSFAQRSRGMLWIDVVQLWGVTPSKSPNTADTESLPVTWLFRLGIQTSECL